MFFVYDGEGNVSAFFRNKLDCLYCKNQGIFKDFSVKEFCSFSKVENYYYVDKNMLFVETLVYMLENEIVISISWFIPMKI